MRKTAIPDHTWQLPKSQPRTGPGVRAEEAAPPSVGGDDVIPVNRDDDGGGDGDGASEIGENEAGGEDEGRGKENSARLGMGEITGIISGGITGVALIVAIFSVTTMVVYKFKPRFEFVYA